MTKRILLIRSLESIAASAEYLTLQGAEVVKAPLQKCVVKPPLPALVAEQFASADRIICLSQNAANSLYRFQGKINHCEIFAIGQRTAKSLAPLFNNVRVPELHTSEGLFQLLKAEQLPGSRILILKGKGGRNWLQPKLQACGAKIQTLDLYQRCANYPDNLKEPETIAAIDAIFVTSGELLFAALNRFGPSLKNQLWVVPGDRIMKLANKAGIYRCINAQSAAIEAMYTAYKKLRWNE